MKCFLCKGPAAPDKGPRPIPQMGMPVAISDYLCDPCAAKLAEVDKLFNIMFGRKP